VAWLKHWRWRRHKPEDHINIFTTMENSNLRHNHIIRIGIPDVPILAWQYRFWELCSMSRLDIWRDTHLYHFSKLLDYINRSQVLSALVALSFSTFYFALIFDITIIKNNITRMICCGFVVVNRRRSEGETIILSKILAQS
jgi:hypothetical protein